MNELQCPNCNTILTGQKSKEKVVCKKCLETLGKRFIMTETNESARYKNMGDGFFQKDEA